MGNPRPKRQVEADEKVLNEKAVTQSAVDNETAVTSQRPLRDPFAPPGEPGNRWLSYGTDGPIPRKYRAKVDKAIDLAYRLKDNAKFRESFRKALSTFTGEDVSQWLYLDSLDKMVINHAETSKDERIMKELQEEARQADPLFKLTPAFSVVGGKDIWIREFQLKKDPKAIASSIVHEAFHLVGAPSNMLVDAIINGTISEAGFPP